MGVGGAIPLLALHCGLPTTWSRRIPFFVGFTLKVATPRAFVRLTCAILPGAVSRTRALTIGRPLSSSALATIVNASPTFN